MEEKDKELPEQEQPAEAAARVRYTSGQKILYTLVSVALFCLLYFGGKDVMSIINRPYNIYLTPENTSPESQSRFYELGGVSAEYAHDFCGAGLYKFAEGYEAYALFSGIEDGEEFAENGITFDYGDPYEYVRIEFFPYPDEPASPEYAFGTQYTDINDPSRLVSMFEFEGQVYAEYTKYGGSVPPEVRAAFSEGEKIY